MMVLWVWIPEDPEQRKESDERNPQPRCAFTESSPSSIAGLPSVREVAQPGLPIMSDDWSHAEVEATVSDYFEMLAMELRGESFNKAEHNRNL